MKLNLKLAVIAILMLSFSIARAQTDTAYYDLGRIKLKKSATQAIVVKGSQLEKYPFINLADALNVWFYGAKTDYNNLIYVIDGVIMNDVDAVSIHDIEEAALIQNAATQISGSTQNQQFVVIRTRRANKSGVVASAQVNLVRHSMPANYTGTQPLSSTTNVFHQYYLAANHAGDKLHAGISGNYQHDAFPEIFASSFNGEVNNIERIKLRGYVDYNVFPGSVISLSGNFTPQTNAASVSSINGNVSSNTSQKLFNGEVGLKSKIFKALNNHITFGYNKLKRNVTGIQNNNYVQTGSYTSTTNVDNSTNILLLKEHLSYTLNAGNIIIEPAVNFMYRTLKDTTHSRTEAYSGNQPSYFNEGSSMYKQGSTFLTPSVSVAYHDLANLQGGFNYVFKQVNDRLNKLYPYVSGFANVAGLLMPKSGISLKTYGSYAKSQFVSDGYNALSDFYGTNLYYGSSYTSGYSDYSYYGYLVGPSERTYQSINAGADIGILKDAVVFRYNFDQRKYSFPAAFQYYNGSMLISYYLMPAVSYSAHRIGVELNLFKRNNFTWISSLNTNNIKIHNNLDQSQPMTNYTLGEKEWTGGWANRFTYKKISAGADVLYFINALQAPNATANIFDRASPFALQNLFAGYSLKTNSNKQLEIFANARNLFQSKKSLLTDQRYYFGLGIKAQL